jgi:hypothetical protein
MPPTDECACRAGRARGLATVKRVIGIDLALVVASDAREGTNSA